MAILEETYLDEALILRDIIFERKIHEYKMLLSISENPHRQKPDLLWKSLDNAITKPEQGAIIHDEELDISGMEMLKTRMKENPRVLVKD